MPLKELTDDFRNLCDMNQEGKLNPEQFALAMWLIQQKQAGKDPPAALTPDMVPPSLRAKALQQVRSCFFRLGIVDSLLLSLVLSSLRHLLDS